MRKRLPGSDIAGLVLVRDAVPADAGAVAAIGRVGFPMVHETLLGPAATAAVVEQTYAEDAVSRAIERCDAAPDAHFLVAERDGRVAGYLHFDSFGDEPELHRIYVDPGQKGLGVGTALIEELHRRIGPEAEYVLMVAAANRDGIRFYQRHGLVEERRVDGTEFYRRHMGVHFPSDAPRVEALVMRRRAQRSR